MAKRNGKKTLKKRNERERRKSLPKKKKKYKTYSKASTENFFAIDVQLFIDSVAGDLQNRKKKKSFVLLSKKEKKISQEIPN